MKKFKHTNADLEMARIQTEKEKTRAQSADVVIDDDTKAHDNDNVNNNDKRSDVSSDQNTDKTARGHDKSRDGDNNPDDDYYRNNGQNRRNSRPGHIKNISNRSEASSGTARYKK